MDDLRVTLVQCDIVWENPVENKKRLAPELLKLADQTDLIILPEMFTTGFTLNGAGLAETMDDDGFCITAHWLAEMASATGAAVTGSCIVRDDDKLYNRLLWLTPDGTMKYYDKHNLFSFAREDTVFSPGENLLTVNHKGWRIRPFICFDLRFPEWSSRKMGAYDLGIYVASWPDSRAHHWRSLLVARAIENQIYLAGVNRVGRDGNQLSYSGDSLMVDPQGEVLHELGNSHKIQTCLLSYQTLMSYRDSFPL